MVSVGGASPHDQEGHKRCGCHKGDRTTGHSLGEGSAFSGVFGVLGRAKVPRLFHGELSTLVPQSGAARCTSNEAYDESHRTTGESTDGGAYRGSYKGSTDSAPASTSNSCGNGNGGFEGTAEGVEKGILSLSLLLRSASGCWSRESRLESLRWARGLNVHAVYSFHEES